MFVVAAGVWAAAAAAQPGGPPVMFNRPFMDDGAMRAIGALLHADGLSDAQRQQLHAVMEADRTSAEPLLDQLRTANEALVDALLAADAPSSDTLDDRVDRINDLRKQLLEQQVQTVLALREVLSPEQLQAAVEGSRRPDERGGVVFFSAP